MDKHYVCPECGGVSPTPKDCDTEGCHLHGSPLEECTCTDNKHSNVLNENI